MLSPNVCIRAFPCGADVLTYLTYGSFLFVIVHKIPWSFGIIMKLLSLLEIVERPLKHL